MNKLTLYPFIIVLLITLAGFYFLHEDKSRLTTDIDQLKQRIETIHQENRQLHLRITALEDSSVVSVTEKAGQTLRKTMNSVLDKIDKQIDEARVELESSSQESPQTTRSAPANQGNRPDRQP